jgi:glycosyltransferase involved in cell wall biosynthesis
MWRDKIEDYDIIHLFRSMSFPAESVGILQYAKKADVRTAISPIYFSSYAFVREVEGGALRSAIFQSVLRFRKSLSKIEQLQSFDPYKNVEWMLRLSDVILPNTKDELNFLLNTYNNVSKEKCAVVHNGVDTRFKFGDARLFEERFGLRDFILFVGRIDNRKNVLRLIRSFVKSELDTHLVIIGGGNDREYYSLCKKESNNRVVFIPPVSHDSDLLASAYKAAKVVALPSYYETPGLAALEGALAGANIVVTEVGGTKEYFGDYAWYVHPRSKKSIEEALVRSYNAQKTNELSEHVEQNFTWDTIAKEMTHIYKSLLIN